jgi:membrane protein DedA with SNARE-associated domain
VTEPRQSTGRSDGIPETQESHQHDGVLKELREIPLEVSGAAEAVRQDIAGSAIARRSVGAYIWVMDHAPTSTRMRVALAVAIFAIVLAPSLALFYVTVTAGAEATESWFGQLGYFGIFLSNLAGTATVFVPVPGLTAASQALIASSADALSPFAVGVIGGLGMAVGEVTAYVAGMAGAEISREEHWKLPRRIQPAVDRLVRGVSWLMERYGAPTLFTLAAIPNPLFEFAGISAGATGYPFWRFMAAVTPGKILRGLLLAYLGDQVIFA